MNNQEHIIPCLLIDLKIVLELMVGQKRITLKEMESIMNKAGLTLIGEGRWQDSNNVIYSN